jgi:hypothetical protein
MTLPSRVSTVGYAAFEVRFGGRVVGVDVNDDSPCGVSREARKVDKGIRTGR